MIFSNTSSNVRIAMHNIRGARVRSGLTILGVVIGVASIVLAINVGQGVKNQVLSQVEASGANVISIRSGHVIDRNPDGTIARYNLNRALSSNSLTQADLDAVNAIPGVTATSPLADISAEITDRDGNLLSNGYLIATNSNVSGLLGRQISYGSDFSSTPSDRTVLIGASVADQLFGDPSPIGSIIKVRGQDFVIKGVFERFPANPINLGIDYNNTVFVDFSALHKLQAENTKIKEILVRGQTDLNQLMQTINQKLHELHNQEDYSVLRLSELEYVTEDIFQLVTALVAAVAAISLIVGGIGIMNIMLVNVAERTREIGIRKAIGASNWQVLSQFLSESIVLSVTGGFIGVFVSQLAGLVIRTTTNIKPAFSPTVILLAIAMSVIVGVLFGAGPAWKASRKKPIDALRS
ncbi:ABC transporter permease [Candidatus Saccharibacteria bacterium]|nr:ABC transporter permease [Candidatus Saccharibacteria bacterium]MCB9821159.1 ABC transporter permease [Candidatus Nomurabacteria bacterium]